MGKMAFIRTPKRIQLHSSRRPHYPGRKRFTAFLGATATLVALIASQAPASASSVDITMVTSWSAANVPALPGIINSYERLHPGVHISLSYVAGSAGVEKLHAEFLSGTEPDIVGVFKKDFNGFQQAGYLTNLTPWLKKIGWYSGYFVPGAYTYTSPLSQATNPHPQVYGIDDTLQPSVIFYNIGLFKKYHLSPPTDLAQLLSVSSTFKSHGILPMCIDAGGTSNNDMDPLAKLVAQYAGANELLAIDNGKAKFTNPPMMAAAKVLGQLVHAGVIGRQAAGANQPACESLLARGKAAMDSMHTGVLPSYTALEKSVAGFKLGIIPSFKFTSHPVSEYTATYGQEWVIPRSDHEVAQTEDFLKYMFSCKNAAAEVKVTGLVSDVACANKTLTGRLQKIVVDNIEPKLTTQSLYMIDFVPTQVQATLGSGIQSLVLGKITYQQLMQKAQQTMNQVLATQG